MICMSVICQPEMWKTDYVIVCEVFSKTIHTQTQMHWNDTRQMLTMCVDEWGNFYCCGPFSCSCILQAHFNESSYFYDQKIILSFTQNEDCCRNCVQDGLGSITEPKALAMWEGRRVWTETVWLTREQVPGAEIRSARGVGGLVDSVCVCV